MSISRSVGVGSALCAPFLEERSQQLAGFVAEAAIGAAVQDQVGEGSAGHRARIVRGDRVRPG